MISFTVETQRPVHWTCVTWCFVLLAALCCCNGQLHQETAMMGDPLQSASKSSKMPDTTKQPANVAVDLGALLDAGEDAVVTLSAGDTQLAAHRAVLAARSPVIAAMFHPDTLEASNSEVAIPDVEGPVLRQLVAFLYTGRVPQLPSMAPQLLAAADKYGVSALRDASELQVLEHLDVENAAAAAVVGVRHSRDSLRTAAIAFIRAHIFEVLATQGWAEALINHPREVVQIYLLLAEPPAKASTTTTLTLSTPTTTVAHATSTATSTGEDSTSTAAIAPTDALATTTTGRSTSTPTAASSTTLTATAQPHSGQTATTPQLPAAGCYCPPLDTAAVSRFRNLSLEEKGRRLRQAAKDGSSQQVRALLAAGADLRSRNEDGWTALIWAANRGHVEAAHYLLQAGAEVDGRTNGQSTPLHMAAFYGHTAVVQLLLAANADPNARDVKSRTPLYWAAQQGEAEVADVLLQVGADKGATTSTGETALDIARQQNKQQLIQMLQ